MSWSSATFITSFDAEAGAVASLATAAQKRLWFNEGQARLLKYMPDHDDLTWTEGDRSITLPSGFVEVQKFVTDEGYVKQPWRVFGGELVIDDPAGASEDGSGHLFYWKEWTQLTDVVNSALPSTLDYACLYYALSRFYRLLSSNRAYYKRYATIVGQNAVSMSDLQQEADRYYQDFLDTRGDAQPVAPAFFFEGQ